MSSSAPVSRPARRWSSANALCAASVCLLLPLSAAGRRSRTDPDLPRLRPVLTGVLYRSGTPSEAGLTRLCQQGYKRIYSLYGARISDKGPQNPAMLARGQDSRSCVVKGDAHTPTRTLEWHAAPASRGRNVPRILRDVLDSVRDPSRGPVLVHCWNGLHYAGMVSAMALRQFCGATPDTAEAYWRATANRDANYPHVIRNIRAFRPLPGLSFSPEERARLCPPLPPPPPPSLTAKARSSATEGGAQ